MKHSCLYSLAQSLTFKKLLAVIILLFEIYSPKFIKFTPDSYLNTQYYAYKKEIANVNLCEWIKINSSNSLSFKFMTFQNKPDSSVKLYDDSLQNADTMALTDNTNCGTERLCLRLSVNIYN